MIEATWNYLSIYSYYKNSRKTELCDVSVPATGTTTRTTPHGGRLTTLPNQPTPPNLGGGSGRKINGLFQLQIWICIGTRRETRSGVS